MELELGGKSAVVTGAGTGIGRGIAQLLASEGVHLLLVGRRESLLRDLAAEIESQGHRRPEVLAQDLSVDRAGRAVADAMMMAFGRADIVINNAGTSTPLSIGASDAEWLSAFRLRFLTVRQLVESCLPSMKSHQYGRVINIGGNSEPADVINAAGVINSARATYAKSLSREVGRFGITVNTIAPGFVRSEQMDKKYTEAQRRAIFEKEIPVGRFGEPADIAALTALLVSPRGSYITGEIFAVDGGRRRFGF